jgi:hypothetical protein
MSGFSLIVFFSGFRPENGGKNGNGCEGSKMRWYGRLSTSYVTFVECWLYVRVYERDVTRFDEFENILLGTVCRLNLPKWVSIFWSNWPGSGKSLFNQGWGNGPAPSLNRYA